jgi:hypothetical protein
MRFTAAAALALTAASPTLANHLFTITNNCAQRITPMLTNTGGPFVKLAALNKGGVATYSVPEAVRADPS